MWIAAWIAFWLTTWGAAKRAERYMVFPLCTAKWKWNDICVGVYCDRKRRRIYFFPITWFGWVYLGS